MQDTECNENPYIGELVFNSQAYPADFIMVWISLAQSWNISFHQSWTPSNLLLGVHDWIYYLSVKPQVWTVNNNERPYWPRRPCLASRSIKRFRDGLFNDVLKDGQGKKIHKLRSTDLPDRDDNTLRVSEIGRTARLYQFGAVIPVALLWPIKRQILLITFNQTALRPIFAHLDRYYEDHFSPGQFF